MEPIIERIRYLLYHYQGFLLTRLQLEELQGLMKEFLPCAEAADQRIKALETELQETREDVQILQEALTARVQEIQLALVDAASGHKAICAFCGEITDSGPEAMESHIQTCETHPGHQLYQLMGEVKQTHMTVTLRGGIDVWGTEFIQWLEHELDTLLGFDRVGKSVTTDYIHIHMQTKTVFVQAGNEEK